MREVLTLSASVSWADHGRDLVNFLLSYIDSPSLSENSSSIQPTLKPVTGLEASLLRLDAASQPSGPSAPAARLWRNKLIVGVGHSMGGTATTFASTADPSLFSSIILCDPGLPPTSQVASTSGKAGGALSRRDRWASRPEASEAFLKKEFFRAWDTRVLQKYVQHALKDSAAGVELKTRAKDEAVSTGRLHCCVFKAERILCPSFSLSLETPWVLPRDAPTLDCICCLPSCRSISFLPRREDRFIQSHPFAIYSGR